MVERLPCKQQVRGSSPLSCSNKKGERKIMRKKHIMGIDKGRKPDYSVINPYLIMGEPLSIQSLTKTLEELQKVDLTDIPLRSVDKHGGIYSKEDVDWIKQI